MKTNLFLAAGLLFSALGFSQSTVFYPTTGVGTAGSSGSLNTFVGYRSGLNATNTGNDTYLGFHSGLDSNGENNCYIGFGAGKNIDGNRNVVIGSSAAIDADGENNVYIGEGSGSNSKGSFNTAVGHRTGGGSGTGIYLGIRNVLIGNRSGEYATGNNNTFVGDETGRGSVSVPYSGSNNIFIGSRAGGTTVVSNRLYIANSNTSNPLIYGEFSATAPQLKFNAQKVGIGYDSSGGFGNFPDLSGLQNGNIYRLFVNGGVLAKEIRVRVDVWADYVFENDYKLLSINETEQYIKNNGHLPNMPSAAEVEKDGIEFGNMAKLQQEKIEELTLHLIEQNKKIEALQEQVQQLLNKK